MYSLWQRSLSTLAFCDCMSNKKEVNFVKDLREIAALSYMTAEIKKLKIWEK